MDFLSKSKKQDKKLHPYIIAHGQSAANVEKFYLSIETHKLCVSVCSTFLSHCQLKTKHFFY